MKKLFIAFACLLAMHHASAQITLSISSYPSPVVGTTDTLRHVQESPTLALPTITTGPNQVWDFTGAIFDSTTYATHNTLDTGAFAGTATYLNAIMDSFGIYYFNRSAICRVDTAGIVTYGNHINKQTIWISAPMDVLALADSTDSMTIFAQDAFYTHTQKVPSFPLTYGTSWTDSFSTTMHGALTVYAFSWSNKPADFNMFYTIYDTVVGWGKLKIKNSNDSVSNIDVLLVSSRITGTEQTIVDGTTLTDDEYHFTELPSDIWYFSDSKYLFYMADEVTPVASITHDYMLNPVHATILDKYVAPSLAVDGPSAMNATISVYPNPVTDRILYIDLPAGNSNWNYELVTAAGQLAKTGALAANHNQLSIKNELAPGIYYLQLSNNGKPAGTRKVTVE